MFLLVIGLLAQNPTWWPMYGRTYTNTHFSPMVGNMTSAPVISWEYRGAGYPEMALSAAQVDDQDPNLEVAVPGYLSGNIALVEGDDGTEDWMKTPGSSQLYTAPAIADLNNDGTLDMVIVYDEGGGTFALNGSDGSTLWNYASASGWGSPKIIDIDQDGEPEAIVSARNGTLYWFNGATGTVEHSLAIGGRADVCPAIADVDEDGNLDIVVTSDTALFLINGQDASVKWHIGGMGTYYSSPTVIDVDRDGHLEIITRSTSNIYCIDRNGATVWSSNIGSSNSSPTGTAAWDVDGDDTVEIFAATGATLYCVNGITGATKWTYTLASSYSIHRAVSLADVDGDGLIEILVPSYYTPGTPHPLTCLNPDGTLQWTVTFGTANDVHDPASADVDADGCAELLVGTYDGSGTNKSAWMLDDASNSSDCGLAVDETENRTTGFELMFNGGELVLRVNKAGPGTLKMYDPAGRLAQVIFSGNLNPGDYHFAIPGLRAGVYLAVATSGSASSSCSVVVK